MSTDYVIDRRRSVPSTQDEARHVFRNHDPTPVLVVADEQTAGRGRAGRRWENAPAALASSLAWRPDPDVASAVPLSLIVGLAVRDAIGELTGNAPGLKWPNDVVMDGVKVGGILVELTEGVAVAGCGLNLWWPSPPPGVGALWPERPSPDARVGLATAWVDRVFARMSRINATDWGRDEYAAACVTLGQAVTWEPAGAGIAVAIALDGGLVVDPMPGLGGSRQVLRSGEVATVRPTTLPPTDVDRSPSA